MSKPITTRILFLVVVEQTRGDAPSSSSFPAAPEARQDSPGLAKTEPFAPAVQMPFKWRAG